MRRTTAALVLSALVLAACGSDGEEATPSAPELAAVTTDGATDGATDEATDEATDSSTDDSTEPDPEIETEPTFEDVGPPPTSPDKPVVEIPAELPTELARTVLVDGQGPAAEVGDTVIVDYIGVRSRDGVEFDNSYDRFEPFPVMLGSGGVIAGWDEGLIGTQAGERLQLDIPSELAYGDRPQGDVIGPDESLTFVIDVRSVIKQSDAADKPADPGVPASEGATEVMTTDLVQGEGATLEPGQTAVIDFVLYRGDNLVELESNWGVEPLQIPMVEGQFLSGLIQGMIGMQVGGRRAITIPPDLAFGAEGNPEGGLPADTDIIIVVDLLGAY